MIHRIDIDSAGNIALAGESNDYKMLCETSTLTNNKGFVGIYKNNAPDFLWAVRLNMLDIVPVTLQFRPGIEDEILVLFRPGASILLFNSLDGTLIKQFHSSA